MRSKSPGQRGDKAFQEITGERHPSLIILKSHHELASAVHKVSSRDHSNLFTCPALMVLSCQHMKELKGKVLLKAKKIGGAEGSPDGTLTDDNSDEEEMANGEALHAESLNQHEKSKLSRELSDLVVYCKSVHFRGFKSSPLHAKYNEMSSFSESKAKRLAKEAGNRRPRISCETEVNVYTQSMCATLFYRSRLCAA